MKRTTIMMGNRKERAEFGSMDMTGLFRKRRVAWCSENEENFKWDEAHCTQGPKRRHNDSSLVGKGKSRDRCSVKKGPWMFYDTSNAYWLFLSAQCPIFCLLKMTTWFSLGEESLWAFCSCSLGGTNQLTSHTHSFSRVVVWSRPGEEV